MRYFTNLFYFQTNISKYLYSEKEAFAFNIKQWDTKTGKITFSNSSDVGQRVESYTNRPKLISLRFYETKKELLKDQRKTTTFELSVYGDLITVFWSKSLTLLT